MTSWEGFKILHEKDMIRLIRQYFPELHNKKMAINWDTMKLEVEGLTDADAFFKNHSDRTNKVIAILWRHDKNKTT